MAANVNKVEEKAAKDSEELAKSGKSMKEIENQLSPHNVASRIKDKTSEGKDMETAPNEA